MTAFTAKSSFLICCGFFSILCKPALHSVCLPGVLIGNSQKVMVTYLKKNKKTNPYCTSSLQNLWLTQCPKPATRKIITLCSLCCFLFNKHMDECMWSLSHSLAPLVGQQCPCHPHKGHSVFLYLWLEQRFK